MNVHGYELTKDWKVSNIGMTALGEKNGKKYFLKKYGEYKMPRRDDSTSPKLYEKLKKEFDDFVNNRVAINTSLSGLAGPGGNITLPSDWFEDDIYYIEATEFIGNLIEDEDILNLPREDILFIMLTATGALHNIHRKNIVHSDLKRTNILAARNSAGRTVAKIIDFDRSYFADNIRPDELGGDQSFMSPELTQCFIYDMADEALAYLSTKSDIFSLGLVFHNYLTHGDFPKIKGLTGALKERADDDKMVYCGEAVLSGAQLLVSKKIEDEYLSHLLVAMLQPEPDDRPTAQEVLEVLKSKRVLDINPDSPIMIEGEGATRRCSEKSTSVVEKSDSVTPSHGVETTPTGYCAPWHDHAIAFNEAKLATNGYIASEQAVHKDVHCYKLFKRNGITRVFTKENLLILGLVSEKTSEKTAAPVIETPHAATSDTVAPSDDVQLWDADSSYEYDMDAIRSGGYNGVCRSTKKGVNGYSLIKTNGDMRFMTFASLKLLGFVKKK